VAVKKPEGDCFHEHFQSVREAPSLETQTETDETEKNPMGVRSGVAVLRICGQKVEKNCLEFGKVQPLFPR
jgi:hypothetical protein